MSPTTVSVVLIGRDVESYLRRLYSPASFPSEWEIIYADSGSTDLSKVVARSYGWQVVDVRAKRYTAAAGRFVGASSASGDWIIFLDSDMLLPALGSVAAAIEELSSTCVGLTGPQTDVDPAQRRRPHAMPGSNGAVARFFGGNVALNRRALIAAGNWNPRLAANEELDLHARLLKLGGVLRYHEALACDHYGVASTSPFRTLASVYFPVRAKDRRYFGAHGIALRESIRQSTVREFLALAPEPSVTLLAMVVAVLAVLNGTLPIALMVSMAWFIWILRRRSLGYAVLLPALSIQAVVAFLFARRSA